MSDKQKILYEILIFGIPILLSILAFIGALAVNALIKMGKDLTAIKVTIERISTKHDGLEKRVDVVEKNVEHLHEKIYQ